MLFFKELVVGFVLAHVIWALFYCTGTLLMTAAGGLTPASIQRHLLESLVRTAFGASIFILLFFILGAAGALRSVYLIAAVIALPTFLFALSVRRAGFPRTLDEVRSPFASWDPFAAAVYAFAVLCFAPALLAPVDFDPGMYHLAHAVDWAHSGRIYVDAYLRFPLFAYNVELIYASLFALGLRFYVQLIDWLAFTWSALAVYAFSLYLLAPPLKRSTDSFTPGGRLAAAPMVSVTAAAVYCASPVVLRYVDTAYVDITVGFFFVATLAATVLAVDRERTYALGAAAIGGSLVGMKLQLVAFVPLIVLLLAYAGIVTRSTWRRIAAWIGTFAVVGAPWYLTNLIVAGDPISPIINIALKRPDPYWSPEDYVAVLGALSYSPVAPILAPLAQFMHPAKFDEFGAPLNVCFVFLPILAAAAMLGRRRVRSAHRPFLIACTGTAYAVFVVYFVSQYFRYSIEFYAAYIAVLGAMSVWFVAAVVKRVAPNARAGAVAAGSVCVLAATAIPSPPGLQAFRGITGRFQNIGTNVTRPARYFALEIPAYPDSVDLSDMIIASGKQGTVLAPALENLAYTFRDHGIVSIGDWFGPARYRDLQKDIDASAVSNYLRRFDVLAVMLGPRSIGFTDAQTLSFLRQVGAAGYTELSGRDRDLRIFVRADVIKAAIASGYRSPLLAALLQKQSSSLNFLDVFERGTINTDRPAGTPTGRGVLLLPWSADDGPYNTITVVSGYSYSFNEIRLGAHPTLVLDVAKPLSGGQDALAWVDVSSGGGKPDRIFTATCPPADGTALIWQHFAVQLPLRSVDVKVTFGASSLPGSGIADWIAFANPILEGSALRSPQATTLGTSSRAANSSP